MMDSPKETTELRTDRTHVEEDKGGIMTFIVAGITLLVLIILAFYCGQRCMEKKMQQ